MDDEYVEAVLAVVEAVPPGRAVSYGAVAEAVAHRLGRGGARQSARVLALHGGGVPWWRVVNAAGWLPPGHEVEAMRALAAEGCPMTADGRRVDLARAGWWPEAGDTQSGDPQAGDPQAGDPEAGDVVSGPWA